MSSSTCLDVQGFDDPCVCLGLTLLKEKILTGYSLFHLMKELEGWIKGFVAQFREEYKRLTEVEKSRVYLDNFLPPCQIEVAHFINPEKQIFIITHFEDRNDLEIVLHGPTEAYNCVDVLETILNESKWDRELSTGRDRTFRSRLENTFIRQVDWITRASKPTERRIKSKESLANGNFVWCIEGNICDLDSTQVVNDVIATVRKRVEIAEELKREMAISPPPKPTLRGYGAYFYPQIVFGDLPKLTFRERLSGRLSWILKGKALDTEYKGHKVVVAKNGFIGIGIIDKTKALGALNEIMATAFFFKFPTFAVREIDLWEIGPGPEDLAMGVRYSTPIIERRRGMGSMRNYLISERERRIRTFPFMPYKRKTVPLTELSDIIKQAERITKDEEVRDNLIYLLEAYTHLENSEYTQSFITSWITIEKHLFRTWNKFLEDSEIKGEREKKLENPAYWTVDYILETLNIAGRLDEKDYTLLIDLKNKLDDIIHKGKGVTKEEAQKCLDTGLSLLKSQID